MLALHLINKNSYLFSSINLSILQIDDDVVVYLAGAHLVTYAFLDPKPVMKFLPVDAGVGISSIAVSDKKK